MIRDPWVVDELVFQELVCEAAPVRRLPERNCNIQLSKNLRTVKSEQGIAMERTNPALFRLPRRWPHFNRERRVAADRSPAPGLPGRLRLRAGRTAGRRVDTDGRLPVSRRICC